MNALEETVIPKFWLGYFREALRAEINDRLLECFETSGMSKADIARKLDRRPEQVTRWLSAPCNLETDTVADLALALGMIPKVRLERIEDQRSNEQCHRLVTVFERKSADTHNVFVDRQFSVPAGGEALKTTGDDAGRTILRSTAPGKRILADA